jgi:hypothetical protein
MGLVWSGEAGLGPERRGKAWFSFFILRMINENAICFKKVSVVRETTKDEKNGCS